METVMPLKNPSIDAEIQDFQDIEEGAEIKVYSCEHDLISCYNNKEGMEDTIFGLWINCGKDKDKAIMFDVEIDNLELFATSVLKQIDIVRQNYAEQIKFQKDNGFNI